MSTKEALLEQHGGKQPEDMEIVSGAGSNDEGGAGTVFYLVRKIPAVTGNDLRGAKPTIDENGRPAVSFSLKNEGARKFGKVTGDNIGRSLAIVLDKRVMSAPRIDGRITDEGRISGVFSSQEVADLSLTLRSGALPATLSYLEERVIGPTLGERFDSLGREGVARRPDLRRDLHARLLQAVGRQRRRRDAAEPRSSCWG